MLLNLKKKLQLFSLYCVKLYGIKDKEFEHYQKIILFYEALQNIKGSPDIIKSHIIKEIKKHNLEITEHDGPRMHLRVYRREQIW